MSGILVILALALGDPDSEALDKFKADYKNKDIAARAAAVEELGKTQSPKICARLGALLAADGPEVRVAAAKGLGLQIDDKKHAIPFLGNGATANAKDLAVLTAIVTALGMLRDEAGASEVNKHVNALDTDFAKAAIEAAGEIRSATSFDPLIKALKECEDTLKPRDKNNPGGGFGGGLGRLGGGNNTGMTFKEMRDRATALKTEIVKVLRDMAKVSCEDAKDWEDWWKEHKATWKAEKS
ncbi:MAG TPA: HEAT repeat domain-containing protein [Planctomycetota bacterium]|nr:HEAT repeat domain-containing protein [Planctomycetota bacterium]